MINTPTGSGARADGYEIRTEAVRHGIPCITTMTGASAASRAIFAQTRGEAEVLSLQELHDAHEPREASQQRDGAARVELGTRGHRPRSVAGPAR